MTRAESTIPASLPDVGHDYDIPDEHVVDFDLTRFPSADAFVALCNRHDLTQTNTVTFAPPEYEHLWKKYYHWYNEELLLSSS